MVKVFDPWKQLITIPEWLSPSAEKEGYTVKFVARPAEQQLAEGAASCRRRCDFSWYPARRRRNFNPFDQSTRPELGIYPVVTQLLYSKLRPRKR